MCRSLKKKPALARKEVEGGESGRRGAKGRDKKKIPLEKLFGKLTLKEPKTQRTEKKYVKDTFHCFSNFSQNLFLFLLLFFILLIITSTSS